MRGRCCFLLLLVPTLASAQPPQRTHTITVDDYFTQQDIFQLATAPDGKSVAYTVGSWNKAANNRKSDLWVVDDGKPARQLTKDRANDRALAWSSDGRTIYFLGNRKKDNAKESPYDGSTQVWKIASAGGEPQAVTKLKDGVQMFALVSDESALYYVTQREGIDDDPWKQLRTQFKKLEYGHGIEKYSVLNKLDLKAGTATVLLDNTRVIRDMALSPDGERFALITTPDSKVVSFEGQSRVDILDLASKNVTTLPDDVYRKRPPSPYGWLEHLAWSSDSSKLAFNVIFDAYPAEIILASLGKEANHVQRLPRPTELHIHGYGSPLAWQDSETLYFLTDHSTRVQLSSYRPNPGNTAPFRVHSKDDKFVQAFSISAKGQLAVAMQDTQSLVDIHLASADGSYRKLTDMNPQVATWKLPQISNVSWIAKDSSMVTGILELPPDYKPGQKLPLVVDIHGGPTTSNHYKLMYWIYGRTLLPARGYAVLSPDYRGSTGYGDRFLTDLIGRENDLDVSDILTGVDAMVKKGIADPDKLAVMGWSNGGYLTNCVLTRTNRFKAAISGAGIVDAVMEFGSNDEPAYAIVFKQGFPWNAAEKYHRASSTYQLDKIKTPTLIHVGGNDERCPPGHSKMLYRVLKEYNRVPTELIVYPGEGHGIMSYENRRAKMLWDLAWLDRYVLGKGVEKR